MVRQAAERVEELLALDGTDARRGLVEDEHARSQPQEAEELELLPLTHAEGLDVGLEVDGQAQRRAQFGDRPGCLRASGDEPSRGADKQVVDNAHGRKVQGVLVEHADAVVDGVGRGTHADDLAVKPYLSAIRRLEAGKDLHQSALAGPVLAEDALDGARGHGEGDAVVGLDRAEILADISDLYFHASSGPVPFGSLR